MSDIDDLTATLRAAFGRTPDLDQRVALLNEVRALVAEFSPFRSEPVDLVQWVQADSVATQHKSAAYQRYQDLMRRRRQQWGVTDQLGYVQPTGQMELAI